MNCSSRVYKTRVVVDKEPVAAYIATTKMRLREVVDGFVEAISLSYDSFDTQNDEPLKAVKVENVISLRLDGAVYEHELESAIEALTTDESYETSRIVD